MGDVMHSLFVRSTDIDKDENESDNRNHAIWMFCTSYYKTRANVKTEITLYELYVLSVNINMNTIFCMETVINTSYKHKDVKTSG